MRRGFLILPAVLVAACSTAGTSAPPPPPAAPPTLPVSTETSTSAPVAAPTRLAIVDSSESPPPQPSPCTWGSGTTDQEVRLCEPEYSEAAKGKVKASATPTADTQGTADVTIRFVIPESERACPAGASRPWYVESGRWTARVTDKAHGLGLVGPPDLVIGP